MAMSSIEDLLQAVSDATSSNASLISGKQQEKAGIATGTANELEALIPTQIALKKQISTAAMNAQNAGIAARDQLENNPNDPDSLMAMLTHDFVENTKLARQQREQVTAKKQVGLFDNPLEFLWNQITLPDEINAMKATQSKADMAKQGIAEMQAMTTASAQAQMATQKTITEQGIAQQSAIQAQELQAQVSKIRMDALGSDIEGIKTLDSANASIVKSRLELLSAQNQIQHITLAKNADEREQKRFNIANTNYQQDEYAQEQEARLASIGAAQAGLKDLTYEELKYQIKNKSISPARLAELRRRGEVYLEQQRAGLTPSPALAETPGRAIISASITGGLDTPQYKVTKDFLESVQNDAAREYLATHPNAKDTPETRRAIASIIDDKLNGPRGKDGKVQKERGLLYRQAENVETEGNLYRAPDLPDLIDLPAIKNSVLYEKVLVPAVAAGVKSSDVQTVLAQAYSARARGEITTEQIAMGMSQLYSSATAAKYVSSMSKFAMPYYSSYNAKVPSAYSWMGDSTDIINFANTDSVLDYLVMMERKQRLENIRGMRTQ